MTNPLCISFRFPYITALPALSLILKKRKGYTLRPCTRGLHSKRFFSAWITNSSATIYTHNTYATIYCLWIGNDLYNIMIMSAIKHFSFISAARFLLGFSFNQIQPKFNRLVLCLWATLPCTKFVKVLQQSVSACMSGPGDRQTNRKTDVKI